MWTFKQSKGIFSGNGKTFSGWAGHGQGKNNPDAQEEKGIGPLPRGKYMMDRVEESPNTGPFTIVLSPDPSNEMFGRGDFRIHGAAFVHPELSSDGCIILSRADRMDVWSSGDHDLEVVL